MTTGFIFMGLHRILETDWIPCQVFTLKDQMLHETSVRDRTVFYLPEI